MLNDVSVHVHAHVVVPHEHPLVNAPVFVSIEFLVVRLHFEPHARVCGTCTQLTPVPRPALLNLPDPLLLRVIRLACTCEDDYGSDSDGPVDRLEAKLRSALASSESRDRPPPGEPRVGLRELCRLRRVCRRLAELVEAGAEASRARLEFVVRVGAETREAVEAELDSVCAAVARMGGAELEDFDLRLSGQPGRTLPAFSLAPLARFRSLRALRLDAGILRSSALLKAEHVAPLASLRQLTRPDLAGGVVGTPVSHAALSALSPLMS
eukprot:tig00020909_g15379.t1